VFYYRKWYVIFAVLEVSFWALTTVVELPRKFLTLISNRTKHYQSFISYALTHYGTWSLVSFSVMTVHMMYNDKYGDNDDDDILIYCWLWHFNSILQLLSHVIFLSILLFSHFGYYCNKRTLSCSQNGRMTERTITYITPPCSLGRVNIGFQTFPEHTTLYLKDGILFVFAIT